MAVANKMTNLLNKIERRLGLIMLEPHLPDWCNKKAWADVINEDTIPTFSRYLPYQIRFPVNDQTCDKRKEDNHMTYYIKDEYLEGLTLLGVKDIDWQDFSSDNLSVSQTAGYGYYSPDYIGGCPICTFETIMGYQMMADMVSLYNWGIYIEFKDPNKIILTGTGNLDLNLKSFVVQLLVRHPNISTISPTSFGVFEDLAIADVANFLKNNLRYVDGLETVYVNIDLKLSDLADEGSRRDSIIEKLESANYSASNSSCPYILSV